MIIIIEGLNGSGKTTLARGLSELTGFPVVRPFRRGTHDHMKGDWVRYLNRLGVPANAYPEDIVATEVLVQTGANAILDRSLPSGVAYGELEEGLTRDKTLELLGVWTDLLKSAPSRRVVYVEMFAHQSLRAQRLGGRADDRLFGEDVLRNVFELARDAVEAAGLPMASFCSNDPGQASPRSVLEVICAKTR